ncbi:UDP-glucosyl transferase family protein [Podospora australis]|uniref:UDP-glucosyl transferase family protein n=1 Tax=Podospora australis TaxID=1536484 RepID=A0AAN7AIR9_9PEZI|nr:UDP-glucosyl transferase family protein [Podospora australis]
MSNAMSPTTTIPIPMHHATPMPLFFSWSFNNSSSSTDMSGDSVTKLPQVNTKILLVSGTGGFPHAAPVLELGRILAQRGHIVEFATHRGQEKWVQSDYYNFVTKVHLMGDPLTHDEDAVHYLQLQNSDPRKSYKRYFRPKRTVDSFWTSDYAFLQNIVAETNPDMIVSDFFIDATRDIQLQTGIPLAMVWPQMPYGQARASYIPGFPGFQIDALTSEHASLWTRLRAQLRPLRAISAIITHLRFLSNMRRASGVKYLLPLLNKPNYLALVNSFWGLETPKDLPPLMAAVGPILADEYMPLGDPLEAFFATHPRVVYVSFGTHIVLQPHHLDCFMRVFSTLFAEGLIDGVIWAAKNAQRSLFDPSQQITMPGSSGGYHLVSVKDILDNRDSCWYFTPFAPQRAILDRPETVLFVTHAGGNSVNEAMFHATPMLSMGFFFDQPLNGLRIEAAGVGFATDRDKFSDQEIADKCRVILRDETGLIHKDVQRMAHIARASARKKYYAADLIEEVMYDAYFSRIEVPQQQQKGSKRRRPMHLQTADARMSVWRARNWDLTVLGGILGAGLTGGIYYACLWLKNWNWRWRLD